MEFYSQDVSIKHFDIIINGDNMKFTENQQKAISHYQKAIQLQPRYADPHNNLGSILMMSGKFEKAIQTFQKIIQTHPNYVAAHNNLGTVLIELREYKKAMTYFQKAIEINPNYAPGYSNLGIVYKELQGIRLFFLSEWKVVVCAPKLLTKDGSKLLKV